MNRAPYNAEPYNDAGAYVVPYGDVLVWVSGPPLAGIRKTPYMDEHFTWPNKEDCDVAGVGPFDYGDSCPVKLSELRALGRYVQQIAPFLPGWPRKEGFTWEFWDEDYLSVRVDQTSARAHNLPDFHSNYIIFGVPPLSATTCNANPRFSLDVSHSDVSVDLSGSLGRRASVWDFDDVQVAGINSVAPFNFAGAGTLKREFVDPWYDRCQYYIGNEIYAPAFDAYVYRRNNTTPAGGWPDGWSDPENDVVKWTDHRYLQIEVTPDVPPTVTDFIVRLQYWVGLVSDNRAAGVERQITVRRGPLRVFECNGQYADGFIWVDLCEGLSGAELDHLQQIEIIFTEPGINWTFEAMDLVRHNDNDPDRDEVLGHAYATFFEVRDKYASGGLQGIIDGKMKSVLSNCGNYTVWSGHSKVVEIINWIFGGIDASVAWQLSAFLTYATAGTEGWNWDLPVDWDSLHKDSEDSVLTHGYGFDLVERPNAAGDARFAGWKWNIPRGLEYAPQGTLAVQGGIQGLSNLRDALDIVSIQRRSGPEDAWAEVNKQSTNGHGYWSGGHDIIYDYDEGTPDWWDYRAVGNDNTLDIGRLYPRQWEAAWLWSWLLDLAPKLAAAHHFTGDVLVTDVGFTEPNSAGHWKVQRGLGWSERFDIPDTVETIWANLITTPARMELAEGRELVQTRLARSQNGDWQDAQLLDANYSCPFGIYAHGRFYISAYRNHAQHLLRHEQHGTHVSLGAAREIAPSDQTAACLALMPYQWTLLCAIQYEGDTRIYASSNDGVSWSLEAAIGTLAYPWLYAGRDYIWLLGYQDEQMKVCSYHRNMEVALPLTAIGRADQGRGAIIRKRDTWELITLAPKTTDWDLAEPVPGIAEYFSSNLGRDWTLRDVHEV